MRQDFNRFCRYCNKSGDPIEFCGSLKKKKPNEEKAPPQPNVAYSQNYPNQEKLPNKYRSNAKDRSNAQRFRSDSPYVANRNRKVVTVTLEQFAWKQGLTGLNRCMTHCSHAMQSFKIIKSPNQESDEPNDIPHISRAGMPGQIF